MWIEGILPFSIILTFCLFCYSQSAFDNQVQVKEKRLEIPPLIFLNQRLKVVNRPVHSLPLSSAITRITSVGSEQRLSGGRPAQAVSGRSQDFARLTGCPLRVVLPCSELPPPNGIVCWLANALYLVQKRMSKIVNKLGGPRWGEAKRLNSSVNANGEGQDPPPLIRYSILLIQWFGSTTNMFWKHKTFKRTCSGSIKHSNEHVPNAQNIQTNMFWKHKTFKRTCSVNSTFKRTCSENTKHSNEHVQ